MVKDVWKSALPPLDLTAVATRVSVHVTDIERTEVSPFLTTGLAAMAVEIEDVRTKCNGAGCDDDGAKCSYWLLGL